MKIVLKHGIIASVVMAAMTGCSPEPDTTVTTVTSVEECVQSSLGTTDECQATWDQAKQENAKVGPRFEDSGGCSSEFGKCEQYVVQNSDGTTSNVFIPMMMGMMMGNMMSNNGSHITPQPLYRSESDRKDGRSGFVAASGVYVNKGSSQVSSRSVVAKSPTSVSRGGFGSIGGRSGGGFSSGS